MATIREWLTELSGTTQSSESDSKIMENLLRKINFPKAIVTMGIVYLEGKGTIDAPPTDIHSMAKMLLKSV